MKQFICCFFIIIANKKSNDETNRKIKIPEPTADEVKALVATLGKFAKVEIKKNARKWFK
ncbi:hypothetical protein [Bacteroides cellulosilyticus]|uniref:hypothetical protein n=1 Tax=Bacteroides cellulosilyticus TaxID=246787 RepID=UPI000760E147|nr:hypothetical protein [Bacteroides cellulosilyticus]